MLRQQRPHLGFGAALQRLQQRVAGLRHPPTRAQVVLHAGQQRSGHLGIGQRPLRLARALCATMGASPTKRAASCITPAASGAAFTIALVMPVSWVMNDGIHTPVFIRL